MKARTIIACAATAAALPLASAWATMPTGPQGTGWYGAPNAATPVPQQPSGSAAAGETRDWRGEARADWRNQQRMEEREGRRDPLWGGQSIRIPALHGHSADTNPPAPPP